MLAKVNQRQQMLFLAVALSALICAVLALSSGPVISDWRLALAWWWPADFSGIKALHIDVVTQIRLPRLVLALMVGCVLAQSGCATQTLCRNPLADPGLIGISAGAAVAALMVISLGGKWGLQGEFWVSGGAFLGALAATLLVYKLAGQSGHTPVATLILAGVAINAFAGAIIGLLSYHADDDSLRLMSFWQMGSLAGISWQQLPFGLVFMGLSSLMLILRRRAINALLLGERQAGYLGVNVQRLKREIILWVALGVGGAVALTGMIGFIGLVIPHISRLLVGADIKRLMPMSMLLGAAVLAFADWLARMLVAPAELPIGIITALVGAPFFLYLLLRQKRHHYA
ncbi:iron ABC transporter permease [Aliiglaciecola sp. CAU 1673]|uniref:FecCD family ABC transporter permease n=1 Tax=Aliiglaciecola sp. CAU 1673 TaxID=3032595 RepID=UPI0023DAC2FE|nr:iron ABC transporter permease [Aliiglaciecola sp. CAU 1673]MDF2180145.1 iron ABC transporter permease [Aliiglaciecola sp. CAU 1673]